MVTRVPVSSLRNSIGSRLVMCARHRFEVPILHTVVDGAEQSEYVVAAA